MTDAPPALGDLLAECEVLGIRLAVADGGGLTIDAPQDALTPELVEALREHKSAILATLSRPLLPKARGLDAAPTAEAAPACAAVTVGLDVPADEGLDVAPAWLDGSDEVDPAPCTSCGGLELWESAGRSARTIDPKPQRVRLNSDWRCCRCDPPAKALQLLELVGRLCERRPTMAAHARKASASTVESTTTRGP